MIKSKQQEQEQEQQQQRRAFEALVLKAVAHSTSSRVYLCKAVHAALRDLFCSKSVDRACYLLDALHKDARRKAVLTAIVHMAGGMTLKLTARGGEWHSCPEDSYVFLDDKTKRLVVRPGRYEPAKAIYEAVKTVDYDCLIVRPADKPKVDCIDYVQSMKARVQRMLDKGEFKDGTQARIVLGTLTSLLIDLQADK